MRSTIITLLIYSLGLFLCGEVHAFVSESEDRKYPEENVIKTAVWLNFENSPDFDQHTDAFESVYIDHPASDQEWQKLRQLSAYVILQLDDKLAPFATAETSLFDLKTITTIRDPQTRARYYEFWNHYCVATGISFFILPEVNPNNQLQQEIISEIHQFNPDLFLLKPKLSFGIPQKKDEFIRQINESNYSIISTSEIEATEKSIKKFKKKLEPNVVQTQFERLKKATKINKSKTELPRIPFALAELIRRGAIIPMQRQPDLLPLKTDTVCLITNNPYGSMAETIRKYAYVITTSGSIIQSKAPIIIDNMDVKMFNETFNTRTLIFIGDLEKGLNYGSLIDAAFFTAQSSAVFKYLFPQLLFGTAGANGRFPVVDAGWSLRHNEPIIAKNMLGYAPPESIGLDFSMQHKIQSIVEEAISTHSTPGCQIAVAKDGTIVYEQGFGYLTYDSMINVTSSTVYDLASVSKVTGTLLAVMKLYDEQKIELDSSIAFYLPQFKESNKEKITLRQLLAHNAGLPSYVPFWKNTIGTDFFESFYYATEEDERLDRRSYGMRFTPELKDSIQNWIINCPLLSYDKEPYYKYSDIGFMILHQVVEAVSGQSQESFLMTNFYDKLGLKTTGYNPLNRGIERFEIAPTEYDSHFRNEQIWGQVHDRNAAIFGGVAGHAGLFSNAHDLLILYQMIIQDGNYANHQFISKSTIDYFNHRYFPNNRRALGWDKKSENSTNASKYASDESFGHLGFTGTLIWLDPEMDLIFVFLSNRVYPNANNYQLIRQNIRTRVQDVVYEAISSKWAK